MASLGSLFKTSSGGTPLKSKKEYFEGGRIPWLLSGEVAQGEVWAANNFITPAGLENSSAKLFPIDTVLVAMYGATAGQVGILKIESATNQAICGVFPNEEFIPKFLYYFLLSKKEEFVGKAVGNAQPNISQTKIRETMVPIISRAEQRRIVAILDEAFEGIAIAKANAEKNLLNAREAFDTCLEQFFNAHRVTARQVELREFCDIKHGYAFDGENFRDGADDSLPILLTPGNFSEHGCLVFKEKNTKRYAAPDVPAGYDLEIGDLVVVMTDLSSKMKILGIPAFVESTGLLHNQRIGRCLFRNGILASRYVYYFMRSSWYTKAIKASSTGTMVKHTAPSRILDCKIPVVSAQEQLAVTSSLKQIEQQIEVLEEIYSSKAQLLDELKSSLLSMAFSGRMRPK